MSNDKAVSEHYTHGDLLKSIQAALAKLGKTVDSVTIEDLAPVDEFHIGGRQATEHFLSQLNFSEQDHILDVGCGLGGASRFVANKYNNQVSGIDLTKEYIETGKALCTWVGLDKQVTLHQGSALAMPFQDEIFDGGFIIHTGMNIENKTQLFTEVYRVLRLGTSFGVYDIMRIGNGELTYPLPWATVPSLSNLATIDQYKQALSDAGFAVSTENNRRDFALGIYKQYAKTTANGGPPILGTHILMRESSAVKSKNLLENITAGHIAPVEIIAQKN